MMTTVVEKPLAERIGSLGRFVGNTPLYNLTSFNLNPRVKLYAKFEWMQLGGSVKSRPAYQIFRDAILAGKLEEGKKLLDASSGNTAIAYASIGASLGIPVTICLPENASNERKKILSGLGTEIVYTSKFGSTDEAQEKALSLLNDNPEQYHYADQYNNENNWKAHYFTTAEEIIDSTKGQITHFVAGLGTTGTFTGAGRRFKEYNPEIKLIGLQPDNAMHGLEGWKHLETAKIPGIYDHQLPDSVLEIDTFEAFEMLKRVARQEGILISPSAAANLVGALKVAESLEEGVVVTTFADNLEKYSELMKMLF